MKTPTVAIFALLLLTAGAACAQESANSASDSSTTTVKPLTVAGKVSSDRRTLVTDIDSEWAISNPDALKGHEGRRVTVKCYVDTAKNRIQVLSVKKDASEATYSAQSTDSAFRR
jgi:hypothetical protein